MQEHMIKKELDRTRSILERELANPPWECDDDSYAQGVQRALDELSNLEQRLNLD